MYSLSIVIPAYNEEANVKAALEEVSAVARRLPNEYEIILVNDGSRDATGDIARSLLGLIPHLRVIEHYPNRGYGGALKAGFAAASKDLITFFPADRQFHFDEVERLLHLAPQADIVCGYRVERRDPLLRRINGWGWNMVVSTLFGYLCRDIDCGFKLFHRRVLEVIAPPSDGAMIDTEFLAAARARGMRIREAPLTHLPRRGGAPTGANLKVIARAFRELVAFRLHLASALRNGSRLPAPASQPGAPFQPIPAWVPRPAKIARRPEKLHHL